MKQKILFLIESLSGGGAEMVLNTLVQEFDYKRYDVTVCCMVDVGKYNDAIKRKCNYCYIVPDATGRALPVRLWCSLLYHLIYFWLPLKWVYRLFVPKGFVTEVAFVEGYVTKLIQYSCKRKVAWVHCDLKEFPWPVNTGIFRSIYEEKAAYARYDEIVVVSESSKRHFIEIYGFGDRTRCIYNPINRTLIREKASIGKRDTFDSCFRFITVGRLTEAKGFDRLIEACNRLKQEGFNYELWIVGEGCDRQKLQNMIIELGVTDSVRLLGFHANPYQLLNQSDCFVCSSRTEGYSLVIAEAMCVGLPVISTQCAGPEEILNSGKYGVMVENSTEGLYQGMKDILLRPDLNDLIKLSHQRSLSFDLEKTMKDVYQVVVEGKDS